MRKNANSPIFKGSSKLSFKLGVKKYILMSCALMILSCGSKKKIVDKREEKIKLDSVASSIKTIDLSKSLKEIRFVPVDISKPIVINQDTIYNTKIIYKDKRLIH